MANNWNSRNRNRIMDPNPRSFDDFEGGHRGPPIRNHDSEQRTFNPDWIIDNQHRSIDLEPDYETLLPDWVRENQHRLRSNDQDLEPVYHYHQPFPPTSRQNANNNNMANEPYVSHLDEDLATNSNKTPLFFKFDPSIAPPPPFQLLLKKAAENIDYYDVVSDDDDGNSRFRSRDNKNITGSNYEKEKCLFDELPFVPKFEFSDELKDTVKESKFLKEEDILKVCDVKKKKQKKGHNKSSSAIKSKTNFVSADGTEKLSHGPSYRPTDASLVNSNTSHTISGSLVRRINNEPSKSDRVNKVSADPSADWLDENGDPLPGAFDYTRPEVNKKVEPVVESGLNLNVEYSFAVKEKNVHSECDGASVATSVISSNVSIENTAGILGSSLQDLVSTVAGDDDEEKRLYKASKTKDEIKAVPVPEPAVVKENAVLQNENIKDRYNRFKRNRFTDRKDSEQESEPVTVGVMPVKTVEEQALESQAINEILKEVKHGAQRAKEFGALGWQRNPVPVVNKTFLRNTLVSTLREPYKPPSKRGGRPHVGLHNETRKEDDGRSRSRSSSSGSSSRSYSHSGSNSSDSRRHGKSGRDQWPPNEAEFYDEAWAAYTAQFGYPWYGPDAYGMFYEEGWPMDPYAAAMYHGGPQPWGECEPFFDGPQDFRGRGRGFRGRGFRGRGMGFRGGWAHDFDDHYDHDEDRRNFSRGLNHMSPYRSRSPCHMRSRSPATPPEGRYRSSSNVRSRSHSTDRSRRRWESREPQRKGRAEAAEASQSNPVAGSSKMTEGELDTKHKKRKKKKKKQHKSKKSMHKSNEKEGDQVVVSTEEKQRKKVKSKKRKHHEKDSESDKGKRKKESEAYEDKSMNGSEADKGKRKKDSEADKSRSKRDADKIEINDRAEHKKNSDDGRKWGKDGKRHKKDNIDITKNPKFQNSDKSKKVEKNVSEIKKGSGSSRNTKVSGRESETSIINDGQRQSLKDSMTRKEKLPHADDKNKSEPSEMNEIQHDRTDVVKKKRIIKVKKIVKKKPKVGESKGEGDDSVEGGDGSIPTEKSPTKKKKIVKKVKKVVKKSDGTVGKVVKKKKAISNPTDTGGEKKAYSYSETSDGKQDLGTSLDRGGYEKVDKTNVQKGEEVHKNNVACEKETKESLKDDKFIPESKRKRESAVEMKKYVMSMENSLLHENRGEKDKGQNVLSDKSLDVQTSHSSSSSADTKTSQNTEGKHDRDAFERPQESPSDSVIVVDASKRN